MFNYIKSLLKGRALRHRHFLVNRDLSEVFMCSLRHRFYQYILDARKAMSVANLETIIQIIVKLPIFRICFLLL